MKLGGAPPRHLMTANDANVTGYFESLPIVEFHDELLASAGSNWHDWRQFNPAWYSSPAAASYKERAKELFRAEFGLAPLPVLKDPRICRFVPFWLDIFTEMDVKPRVVIPIRSPLEVARSLKTRDGMPLSKGLLLWLRHVLDAELQSRTMARSIFTWSDFISDWRRVCEKISGDTGVAWACLSDRSAHDIERFLKTELVHNRVNHAELIAHSDVHEWTIAAYEALLQLAHHPFSNSAAEKLNEIRHLLEQSSAMFGRLLIDYEIGIEESQARLEAMRGEHELLRGRQAGTEAELSTAQRDSERLSAELLARDEALIAAAVRLAEAEAAAARADIGRAQSEAALAGANEENNALRGLVDARTTQVSALLDEKERLAFALEAHRRAAGETMALLASRGAQLEQLEATLATTQSALDTALARHNEMAAELERAQAETQKLDALHQAALAEAAKKNAASEAALAWIVEEKETAAAALDARNRDLEVNLAQILAEKVRLASDRDGLSAELTRLQRASVGEAEATAAAGTELQSRYDGDVQALRSQLVDAEAALAKYRKGRAWTKGLPLLDPGRRAERRLLRSGLFDAPWYKAEYKDAAESRLGPVRHYLEDGYLRGYKPNPFFDTRWYLQQYEDVRRSGMNPLLHYILYGHKEGRDAGPDFHTSFYLLAHPDVRAAGINPLAHYLRHGRAEGRAAVRPQGT